jgi:hypothetical protein
VAVLVPILGWAVTLVFARRGRIGGIRVLPMLVASLLDLVIAIGITWILRRDPARPEPPLRPGRYLLSSARAPSCVTALTLPALAATGGGDAALPNGGLDLPGVHGH